MTAPVVDGPGLTGSAVARSRSEHGANTIVTRRPVGVITLVIGQLRESVILLLLAAAAITVAMRDWSDATVIVLVIVINTALGTSQELRSNRAITALSELTAPRATVLRDGRPISISAEDVVVGDVLELRSGDIVAADGTLLTGSSVRLDESILTGESVPRSADPGAQVHGGSVVVRGHGRVLVEAVGGRTELGAVAATLDTGPITHTPLQGRLKVLGRQLALGASVAALAVVVLNVLNGQSWQTSVVLGLSLAVAAIPESLPAVVTLSLALAAHRMAGQGVLVRSLPAVEALGSVSVLACDKTGTLTEGSLGVGQVWLSAEVSALELWRCGVLCNDAGGSGEQVGSDDPVDRALIVAAEARGFEVGAMRREQPRIGEQPFEAATAMMRSTHTRAGAGPIEYLKGAPETVLAECGGNVEAASAVVARFAADGDRALALAEQEEGQTRLLGLVALTDPVRADSAALVEGFRSAGVRPVMITGDHLLTAETVAQTVGILATGERAAELTDGPVDIGASVFARTRPIHKRTIITAFQQSGEVVAMTGDGVNDAPAMRIADLGVAMGRGTEVAKQAADIVLTDNRLGTMVIGIGEGRRVSDNIRRFLLYGLSGGAAEVLVMVFGPLLGISIPLRAGQILWVNVLTHGLPGVAIGAEPGDPDALRRGPRRTGDSLIGTPELLRIAVLAVAIACASLAAGLASTEHRQSSIFVGIVLCQLAAAVGLRPRQWWNPMGNPLLAGAILLNLGLVATAIYWAPLQDLLHLHPMPARSLVYALVGAGGTALIARALRYLAGRD